MDVYKLYIQTLLQPVSVCDRASSFSLSRQNVNEGAVFVASLSALVTVATNKFLEIPEKMNNLFADNVMLLLYNPFGYFFANLVFLFLLIYTIFSFGKNSRVKRDFNEIGKIVVWICFVALGFQVLQLLSVASLSNFFMIFYILERIWLVWALSSVVCEIYDYRSVLLTAVTGFIVVNVLYILCLMFFILIFLMVLPIFNDGSMNV